jgi:DNA helicase-2/ATP-dependent DNA helicase PcrA
VPLHEIAVCLRTNSQTQAWEETFEKARVPARVHGDRTFFDRPEIRQALRALHEAAHSPPAPAGAPPPVAGTTAAGARRPDRVVEQVLRDRLSWHPRREPDGQAAKQRWRNLSALHDLVLRITEEHPEHDLGAVMAELTDRARTAGPDTATSAVTLLTLHKAKGSEFDAVCLVGLEDGLMPITYAATDDEIAEERRLLYVGMTRARKHLWLSWAQQRRGWNGKMMRRRPSRFLADIQPPPPADQRLAGELRAWRLDRARRDEVPPYVVFSDRTLQELASMRPTSPTELLAIHGFGTTKVRRYGSELLGLLGGSGRENGR